MASTYSKYKPSEGTHNLISNPETLTYSNKTNTLWMMKRKKLCKDMSLIKRKFIGTKFIKGLYLTDLWRKRTNDFSSSGRKQCWARCFCIIEGELGCFCTSHSNSIKHRFTNLSSQMLYRSKIWPFQMTTHLQSKMSSSTKFSEGTKPTWAKWASDRPPAWTERKACFPPRSGSKFTLKIEWAPWSFSTNFWSLRKTSSSERSRLLISGGRRLLDLGLKKFKKLTRIMGRKYRGWNWRIGRA